MVKKLFTYYLMIVGIFFLGRIALFTVYFDRFSDSGVNYWLSFVYGLKMDTMVASMLLIIPLIVLSFSPQSLAKISNIFLRLRFILLAIMLEGNISMPLL